MSADDNNKPENVNPNEENTQASESNPKETMAAAQNAAGNILKTLTELKENNPKVFFGGVGAVVVVVLLLFMSGGSDPKLPVHQAKPIVIGQNYVLKSANAYDSDSTVRLVAVPGSMAAYDDTEEDDREGGCKHMPQGTPVKVIQSQDAYGKKDVFVEVEMTTGECQGRRGWALAIDLQ
ncbi:MULTISPECIES: hypothetical protein [Methylomonas]|uniref:hypothetical protein n=1 Tax=Methylomonas TaxID=416 RepID=UPI001232074A|nr:hypothetical protein [Methylomonas rhizoryzae]